MMLKPFLLLVGTVAIQYTHAQTAGKSISVAEVTQIEKTLSSDEMQGRKVFTPGIEKAADYIISEFKAAGLEPLPGKTDYRQPFVMVNVQKSTREANLDGNPISADKIAAFTSNSDLALTQTDPYGVVHINKGEDFMPTIFKYLRSSENYLIFVDTAFEHMFDRLTGMKMPQFENGGNKIVLMTTANPKNYTIRIRQEVKRDTLTNIVGVLPGKSKKDESVIFSAHYDHLGIIKPDAGGDSIYNGANDDASGTTAVITLAKYFSKLHSNNRTLIFAAFTAEEIGEFGSAYFSHQFDPAKVMAMFNIEMIGTESKWGKNSCYITGYDRTDMGAILQKNLLKSPFKFYPDPYTAENLFFRSDNASLAKVGVPAHTISTSKMDSEKNYHTAGDEIGTLDMQNMTEVIKAIALSSRTIVAGTDTPKRVKL